jgi:hypothetical protein
MFVGTADDVQSNVNDDDDGDDDAAGEEAATQTRQNTNDDDDVIVVGFVGGGGVGACSADHTHPFHPHGDSGGSSICGVAATQQRGRLFACSCDINLVVFVIVFVVVFMFFILAAIVAAAPSVVLRPHSSAVGGARVLVLF